MREKRKNRVGQEIKKVLSYAISYKLKDPQVKELTSVSDVDVSRDLSYADIYVTVMGTEWEKKQTIEALTKARGFLKHELSQEAILPSIPELRFHLDQSIDYGMHMDALIEKVIAQDEKNQADRQRGLEEISEDGRSHFSGDDHE